MEECLDGEYQAFKANGGGYIREHFFGKYPELKKMVEHLSDDEIYYDLVRGGHDARKVYAAYDQAMQEDGQPTLILAKTVKGYRHGRGGRGTEHHPLAEEDGVRTVDEKFAERFQIPVSKQQKVPMPPCSSPAEDSEEMRYLHERRKALGGYLPSRRQHGDSLEIPDLSLF